MYAIDAKGSDYHCIFSLISKNEAIKLMQNADLTEKTGALSNIKNLLSCIKMGEKIIKFGDIEVEKNKFYCHETPIFKKDVDIEKVLVSSKISFSEKTCKNFIANLYNNNKVKPLHIMLSKTSAYVKRDG